jgi:hypothetical protein
MAGFLLLAQAELGELSPHDLVDVTVTEVDVASSACAYIARAAALAAWSGPDAGDRPPHLVLKHIKARP